MAVKLPPLRVVQAALRKTTETLAAELSCPSENPPDWSELEWRIARAVVSLHGLAGLLSRVLRWQGPRDWVAYLEEQAAHTLVRHQRMSELLQLVDTRARECGIAFVALKGAALHLLELYAPGERPMADLDLLTRPADMAPMANLLRRLGFQQSAATWKHLVFEPLQTVEPAAFGENAGNFLKVDVHFHLPEILPLRPIDVAPVIFPEHPGPGLNSYRSQAALMLHLLQHAAGAILYRTVRLVQLHDMALLSARMSAADWDELCEQRASERGLWWAFAPLSLVSRYYHCIPERVLRAAEADCRWPLRRATRRQLLTDASFSDLRRSVLPGIEWSQSTGELLEYVRQRLILSAQIVLRRPVATDMQLPPAESRKLHLTRKAQGVRWLAMTPVRPATLNAVRFSIGQ